jgi:hypothetical protein
MRLFVRNAPMNYDASEDFIFYIYLCFINKWMRFYCPLGEGRKDRYAMLPRHCWISCTAGGRKAAPAVCCHILRADA